VVKAAAVFGLGYAGLTFSVALAYRGYRVVGVDVDFERVNSVNKGLAPFYEPKIDELLNLVVKEGKLTASTDYSYAVLNSDVLFIFVSTPSLPDGSCDLSNVRKASEMIGEALKRVDNYRLVVVRSTVPPGTTEGVVKPVVESVSGKFCGRDFGLVMNPEFIREGTAIEDHLKPSRVVIGEFDKRSGDVLENFYKEFLKDWACPILRTSTYNAELIKYAANSFLALKLSFINTIARLCEKIPKADVKTVAEGIGLDPRIGRTYLNAGLGFGGSCLPKDVKAIVRFTEGLDEDPSLFKTILNINEGQVDRVIWLLKQGLERSDLKNSKVAVLGLSFKPNTDDIRESQSIKLVKKLIELGVYVKVHDPIALENAKKELNTSVDYCDNIYECFKNVDAIIIATDWPQYKELDLGKAKELVANPLIIDGRRIIDPNSARKHGFKYLGIGLSIK